MEENMIDSKIDTKEKTRSGLLDYNFLNRVSKILILLGIINTVFVLFYLFSFLFGRNYTENDNNILENVLSKKLVSYSSENCSPDSSNFWRTKIRNFENSFSYLTNFPINERNICETTIPISYVKGGNNLTCFDNIYLNGTECPFSVIYENRVSDPIFNSVLYKKQNIMYFGYKPKLRFDSKCNFMTNIDLDTVQFTIPFLYMIIYGIFTFGLIAASIYITIETKDDKSRPPLSSSNYTEYVQTGTINTYVNGNLRDEKAVYGNRTRVIVKYHQIPMTISDKVIGVWCIIVSLLVLLYICYINANSLYGHHNTVKLCIKVGTEKCINDELSNEIMSLYGKGIYEKLFILFGTSIGVGVFEVIVFIIFIIMILKKISFKDLFFQ